MLQTPLNMPVGAQVSAPITTNATTLINSGSAATLAGIMVNTAGSAWVVEAYNGDPATSGVLVETMSGDTVGPVVCPLVRFPNGLYIKTSGTTPGSLNVAFYA